MGQHFVQVVQRLASLTFNKFTPQIHDIGCAIGKIAPRGPVPDQIARSRGQRCICCFGDAVIALVLGFSVNFDVHVGGRARHIARADRLTACGFQRIINIARHLSCRGVAVVSRGVVVAVFERQAVGYAARHQHLVARHAARHLW